jgi:hypothetical protein
MTAKITTLAAIAVTVAATLLPPPRIRLESPRVLYTIAMYKAAMGDTAAALKLVRRAEASQNAIKSSSPATHSASAVAVSCPDRL